VILVLLGTCAHGFERLAKAVEDFARQAREDVSIQLGWTSYRPAGVRSFDFVPHNELLSMIGKADLIIAHGGFATLGECLDFKKRIVAVPRKKEYGETLDSGLGQEEIVRQLEKEGKVIGVYDIRELPEAIERARVFQPPGGPHSHIPELVRRFARSVFS
jgi:UDP-N-acetylglucosamine transferase subunit ALG13